jgi:hypothetical protein
MIIIGCDFHTRYQQIAMANDETGELRLDHTSGGWHTLCELRTLGWPILAGMVYARVGHS